MFEKLFEKLTGRPWMTERSCTAEFGPTIGARYAAELADLTDAELMAMDRGEVIAYAQHVRAVRSTGWQVGPIQVSSVH